MHNTRTPEGLPQPNIPFMYEGGNMCGLMALFLTHKLSIFQNLSPLLTEWQDPSIRARIQKYMEQCAGTVNMQFVLPRNFFRAISRERYEL